MKKILLITMLLQLSLFSSTINNLNLSDDDFLKIMYSSKKIYILDRISELITLKKSLENIDNDFVKLRAINNHFNEYEFKDDKDIYNKDDYWATRKEFIYKGSGDCEDFVIAKYFTLLEVGVDESKLSLIHNMYNNEYHLVLGYQENEFSDLLILDNINKDILPLTKRDDIMVLYTLEIIDLSDDNNFSSDIRGVSNYKWSKIYRIEKGEN